VKFANPPAFDSRLLDGAPAVDKGINIINIFNFNFAGNSSDSRTRVDTVAFESEHTIGGTFELLKFPSKTDVTQQI
jgi:hypothetical protein